jgi:peptidoglycan/LPS O-acetylase OafA/YrhL
MWPVPDRFRLGYQPSLDGLRAVAISLVVLYHTGSGGQQALRGGLLGVDLFFALSGYLITGILLEEWSARGSIDLPRFYARRLLRLAPALTVFVAVVLFVTHVVYPELAGTLRGPWAAAALLYVSNLVIAYGREYPLGHVSICWSLAIEEQFYLLWPIALRTLLRRGIARERLALLVLAVSALPTLVREVLTRQGAGDPTLWLRVYFGSDTRADTLLLGCALGLLFAGRAPAWPRAGLAASLAGGAVVAWFAGRYGMGDLVARPYRFTATSLACAALLFGVLQGGPLAWLLSARPLAWIGRLSYSLYLWHVVGLGLTGDLPFVARAALLLGFAAASYYLIERPFLAIKDRLHPRVAPAREAPPAPSMAWTALRMAGGLTVLGGAVAWGYARSLPVAALGLRQSGDAAAAVRALERAASWSPHSPGVLASLGFALLDAGRHEEAQARFEQVLRTHPTSAVAHAGLGQALARRGQLEAAVRHLAEAARLQPEPATLAALEKARAELAARAE